MMMYLGGAIYILKVAATMAGVGLVTTLAMDKDLHVIARKIKKKVGGRMKGLKGIPLDDCHIVVLGLTRHGKTYALKKSLASVSEGVFFFNTQLEEMPGTFIDASGANAWEQIDGLLEEGRKVNFLPSTDKEARQKQLQVIIKKLYDGRKRNIRFVVDEAHLFKKEALAAVQEIATTGLRFGIRGVFISQRGALLDNTLISQSNQYIFFYMNNHDREYFKNYGFPIEEIQERINGEKYLFCTYDNKEIKGAFKIV